MEKLKRGVVETSKGSVAILVTEDGKYHVWRARDGRVRWALAEWPDDGWGVKNYGASWTVRGAIEGIQGHRELILSLPP